MSSTKLERLASMAEAQILGGLSGVSSTINLNRLEIEDQIVGTYMQLVTNYSRQNLLPASDLYLTLNCIPVDCKTMNDCCDEDDFGSEEFLHFRIPLVCFVADDKAIAYIGNTEKTIKFRWFTSPRMFELDKYRMYKSKKTRPTVLIMQSPRIDDADGLSLLDCYIRGLDYLEAVSITAIFKDIRLVAALDCCSNEDIDNISALDNEVVDTVVKKFFTYYRQALAPVLPNSNNPGNNYPGATLKE